MRGLRDLADGEILLSVMRDINLEERPGRFAEILGGVGDQKPGKTWGKTMENDGKTMEKPWKMMEKPWNNDGKTMENDGRTMEK